MVAPFSIWRSCRRLFPQSYFICGLALYSFFCIGAQDISAQEISFTLDDYNSFLEANEGLLAGELLTMHQAGTFYGQVNSVPFRSAEYSDSIRIKYELTPYEEELIDKHGFAVTERLSFDAFGSAFFDVYTNDLPVFISTDAILHALHMSYSQILKDTETSVLIPRLEALLADLHANLDVLSEKYADESGMVQPIRDMDVYLTIARHLLSEFSVSPTFSENEGTVEELLGFVEEELGWFQYPLFAEKCRLLDFSQFTPRGHYTESPALTRYFQTMMWLGRTEIYLSAPKQGQDEPCQPSEADVQRQTILALLLVEAAELNDGTDVLEEIEAFLQLFVGESDNVTLPHLQELKMLTGLGDVSDLVHEETWLSFQAALLEQAWSQQRILSQILKGGAGAPVDQIQPASAFLLMGQRFVIDSYVTGSVVYDRIPGGVRRMLPDPLDVLFSLGNDAAAQLLEPELNQYHYAPNLAALRFLVDSYEDAFWQQSLYNSWLSAIRTLNPPEESDRNHLPAFMQTAAWWQQKMNTQLASWAQLRHDNLLYAKQSYSGVPLCDYPYSYVEPIPEFYEAVSLFARNASERFGGLPVDDRYVVPHIQDYFEKMAGVNDTLAVIAQKELDGIPVNERETDFLGRLINESLKGCYKGFDGWYNDLFYGYAEGATEPDMVVADIHTAPADQVGTPVGWVLHVGTGPINMALVTAEVPGEGMVAFIGPVMSYYEHLSTGFNRLTDELWETSFNVEPSYRPDYLNVYLANEQGESRGEAPTLALRTATSVEESPLAYDLKPAKNFPNPFQGTTNITFSVPTSKSYQHVELEIYDARGALVGQLVDEPLPSGHYSVRWDAMLQTGSRVASGVYFCRLRVGEQQVTTPMANVN